MAKNVQWVCHTVVWFHLNWLQESLFWLVHDNLKIALRVYCRFLIYILYPVDLVKLLLVKVWKQKNRLTSVPVEKVWLSLLWQVFFLWQAEQNQVNWILTVALSALVAWSRLKPMETMVARCSSERLSVGVVPGPELQPGNTRGAAKSAANHTEENMRSEPSTLTEDFLSFWQTSRSPTHRGLPYGSWSNSWQHRFQCCQCSTPLFCMPPAGIPFHTTGTQWSHQGLELRVRWEEKKGLYEKCISMC